jgi:hypothetical protein
LSAPGDDHLCAVVREQLCGSKPNAAASTRHESRFAVKDTHVLTFLVVQQGYIFDKSAHKMVVWHMIYADIS